jgi:hypothetical protein
MQYAIMLCTIIIVSYLVKPGHMMLEPFMMNLIAPLSTCIFGIMSGSVAAAASHSSTRSKLMCSPVITV